MIYIKNALTFNQTRTDLSLPSDHEAVIDATGLTLLPGLIDPHVHFRTPGLEHKEDWRTAAKAALRGGYTTVFDMPNTLPPTVTAELLQQKKKLIDEQLAHAQCPLRYELYFGADKHHFHEISQIKNEVIGIKVFMGCSTGNLVIDDDESLHAVFESAAKNNLLIAVHAEDEALIKKRKTYYASTKRYADHSLIRDTEVAAIAVEKAITLSKKYSARLYILHVSSQDEIQLIKQAKQEKVPVYAETTPHHLFLDEKDYSHLKGKAVVNPPLRTSRDRDALWQALSEGLIDTIGSDHAPHLLSEKCKPYGECPSGMPGIETTLPLLMTAHRDGLLSLERILALTHTRTREIFNLPLHDDLILVDLQTPKKVYPAELQTKCTWSAFEGRELVGWVKHVILRGQHYVQP